LVSVRDLSEANLVGPMGITILDVKEPGDGPLAPTSVRTWTEIAAAWGRDHVLSAALGEFESAVEIASYLPAGGDGFALAKMGPAGSRTIAQWERWWVTVKAELPHGVSLVAVAYADHEVANCPPAIEIFEAAKRLKIENWLVDTFQKDGRSTLDHLSAPTLATVGKSARQVNAKWAIAGSIRYEVLEDLCSGTLCPDWIGVRGGVCDEKRSGRLDPAKIAAWLSFLAGS